MSTPDRFSSIPVVDIAGLFGDDDAQARVARDLGAAAREVGFLYVRGHGLDPGLYDNLLAAAKRFFALPMDRKMEVFIGRSRNHRGYVPAGEEIFASGTSNRKEAFDLSRDLSETDPDYIAGNPLLGPNQWPELAGWREPVNAYYEAVFGLARMLMRGFAMALGETPDFFDSHITKPPSQLRLIHYPHDPSAIDKPGSGAHTDYECFTLLTATGPGLEVMNGDGAWIDAPPVPGAFLVNIGDMLELLTNGHFVATTHRVRNVKEERFSFPLFFAFDYDTEVKPLARFVAPGETPRPAIAAGEHLFAQTAQSFHYLRERLARGEIRLPDNALGLSSFGREARQRTPAR